LWEKRKKNGKLRGEEVEIWWRIFEENVEVVGEVVHSKSAPTKIQDMLDDFIIPST
jgi:hypothetical protein